MNEYGFIRYVHSKLDPSLLVWKIHDQFQGGVPDAFYLGKRSLWVEYKYVKALPVRDTTTIKTCLTEQQRIWLDKLEAANEQCALAIGCGDRVALLRHGLWRKDLTRTEFLHNSMSRRELAAWIEFSCT